MALGSFVFFGSDELEAAVLEALREGGRIPAAVVVRGRMVASPEGANHKAPVIRWAEAHGIEVAVAKPGDAEATEAVLTRFGADVAVVADPLFDPPVSALGLPPRGWLELHPSQLPKYRGPSPIRSALSEGERTAGVTVIRPIEEPDAGPIVLQEKIDVEPHDSWVDLHPRLAVEGAKLLLEALAKLEKGQKLAGTDQKEKQATLTPLLTPRHRRVPWNLSADAIYNRLRAHLPAGLTTRYRIKNLRILRGIPTEWVSAPFGSPGTFLGLRQGRLAMLCGEGTVFGITQLQVEEGGELLRGSEYVHREGLRPGRRFT